MDDVAGIQAIYGAFDDDGDGITIAAGDCNDTNPSIFPGAPQQCDGVDTDCDGHIDPRQRHAGPVPVGGQRAVYCARRDALLPAAGGMRQPDDTCGDIRSRQQRFSNVLNVIFL